MIVVLLILTSAVVQTKSQCSSTRIEAIYPCTINFKADSSNKCQFSSCYTESPGNPQNATDWKICYNSCCPGFLIPTDQSRDALNNCYAKFSQTPDMVPIIGILFGAALLILYVVLPCCENRYCPLYRFRLWLCCQTKPPAEVVAQQVQQQVIDNIVSNQNLMRIENAAPGADRFCLLCNFPKASCDLKCGHTFHFYCLQHDAHQNCPVCHNAEIYPVRDYCRQCFAHYELRMEMNDRKSKFRCLNCLLG